MSLPAVCEPEQIPRSASRVRIAYTDGYGERSIRVIEPLSTYQGRNGHTYLRAWCHLRQEERTFRLDRIRSWEQLGEGKGGSPAVLPALAAPPTPETSARAAAVATAPSRLSQTSRQHADKAATIRSYPVAAPAPAAVPAPATRPVLAAATVLASAPRAARRRHPLRTLFLLGLVFLAGRWLVTSGTLGDIVQGIWDSGSPAVRTVPAPASNPAAYTADTPPRQPVSATVRPAATVQPAAAVPPAPPAPPAPPPFKHFSYRGVAITGIPHGSGYLYRAGAYNLSSTSRRDLHLKINSLLFRQATGIDSPPLEELYAGADGDRDGHLSWQEIGEFQHRLTRTYRYRANATALRPDEFLAQGGGDCEDWALLTCGLLRYWGWTAYVASFCPPGGSSGHAVCMVRRLDRPPGCAWYTVEEGMRAWDGGPVEPGWYLPIDYEVLGGTSSAVGRGWRLERFYTPEKIYGWTM